MTHLPPIGTNVIPHPHGMIFDTYSVRVSQGTEPSVLPCLFLAGGDLNTLRPVLALVPEMLHGFS